MKKENKSFLFQWIISKIPYVDFLEKKISWPVASAVLSPLIPLKVFSSMNFAFLYIFQFCLCLEKKFLKFRVNSLAMTFFTRFHRARRNLFMDLMSRLHRLNKNMQCNEQHNNVLIILTSTQRQVHAKFLEWNDTKRLMYTNAVSWQQPDAVSSSKRVMSTADN